MCTTPCFIKPNFSKIARHMCWTLNQSLCGNANYSDKPPEKEIRKMDANLQTLTEGHHPPMPMTSAVVPGKGPPPELPTTCCMSGCANCVWLNYAGELLKYYQDGTGKQRALEEIEKLDNPMLKAFLKLELS